MVKRRQLQWAVFQLFTHYYSISKVHRRRHRGIILSNQPAVSHRSSQLFSCFWWTRASKWLGIKFVQLIDLLWNHAAQGKWTHSHNIVLRKKWVQLCQRQNPCITDTAWLCASRYEREVLKRLAGVMACLQYSALLQPPALIGKCNAFSSEIECVTIVSRKLHTLKTF